MSQERSLASPGVWVLPRAHHPWLDMMARY
ncbi:Uncharacterized protein HZ326_30108, partial [Fusarium oxysporum f. sp. albedinis]